MTPQPSTSSNEHDSTGTSTPSGSDDSGTVVTSPVTITIPLAFQATIAAAAKKGPKVEAKCLKRLHDLLSVRLKSPTSYSSFQCPPTFEMKSTFSFDGLRSAIVGVETSPEPMELGTRSPTPEAKNRGNGSRPGTSGDRVTSAPPRSPKKHPAVAKRRVESAHLRGTYPKATGRPRSIRERLGTRPVALDPSLVLPVRGAVSQAELMRLNGIELAGKIRTFRRRQSKMRNLLRKRGVPEDQLHYRYIWNSKGAPKGGGQTEGFGLGGHFGARRQERSKWV